MNPTRTNALSNTELLRQEFEKRERKREQNRIAQRTYRQSLSRSLGCLFCIRERYILTGDFPGLNQKRRIRALETAVKRSSHAVSPLESPPPADAARMERLVSPIHHRSNLMLGAVSGEISNSAATSNTTGEAIPRPEPWSTVPGLDSCPPSADIPELPEGLTGYPPNRTPLQIAIQNRNASLVQLLLREGADVTKQDQDGSTALHIAVESGQEDIVSAILKRVVDPNELDYSGRTALFRAIEAGNHAVARILLDSASDPNIKDVWGKMPLHLAVEANSETLALLLIEYGAHIDP